MGTGSTDYRMDYHEIIKNVIIKNVIIGLRFDRICKDKYTGNICNFDDYGR